ncbi:unnamed protein product [Rhizoctonia solani]|uniref:Uncharacterized protein n=1 Tax=Rhizoctonia solani TaxID=456999 RepID=A0A8H3AS41_9AGAM|nr:unnamed protein product [Rhizoctonia solani]
MYNHAQASTNLMDYTGSTIDELEQINALTLTQWLTVLWIHIRQGLAQLLGLFVTLLIGLVRVPTPPQFGYVEDYLKNTVLDPAHSETHTSYSEKILEKICAMRRPANGDLQHLPFNPSLKEESMSLTVIIQGGNTSKITVSSFQEHILRRIELQGKLVERVGLGASVKISTELQNQLSLVWATLRNDTFDTDAMVFEENEYQGHTEAPKAISLVKVRSS